MKGKTTKLNKIAVNTVTQTANPRTRKSGFAQPTPANEQEAER